MCPEIYDLKSTFPLFILHWPDFFSLVNNIELLWHDNIHGTECTRDYNCVNVACRMACTRGTEESTKEVSVADTQLCHCVVTLITDTWEWLNKLVSNKNLFFSYATIHPFIFSWPLESQSHSSGAGLILLAEHVIPIAGHSHICW